MGTTVAQRISPVIAYGSILQQTAEAIQKGEYECPDGNQATDEPAGGADAGARKGGAVERCLIGLANLVAADGGGGSASWLGGHGSCHQGEGQNSNNGLELHF